MEPLSHRRQLYDHKREIRRAISQPKAAAAIGAITHGMEVFVLNGGKFSLIDVLSHILDGTGPADVTLSTWSAAGADLGFAYRMLTDGRIRTIRFLTDFSFQSRQPAYLQAMREKFGDSCIRIVKNHCKFLSIRNDQWNVVVRTSANLNENISLEYLEVSDDPGLAQFLDDFVTEIFRDQPAEGQFERRPIDICHQFERLTDPDGKPDQAAMMNSTDTKKFYSDDPYGNDLRRTGLSYLGGKTK